MRRELFVLVSASAIALGAACSSSSTSTNGGGTDSGINTHPATDDSGAGGTDSGDTDSGNGDTDAGVAGDSGLHGCATYVDNTAKAEVDLTWDFSIANQADRCSKIKAGKVVKWTGNFGTHPLEANGGDTPTPIGGNTPDGGAIYVTFPNAGLFGYDCQNHPSAMFGAIQVVP